MCTSDSTEQEPGTDNGSYVNCALTTRLLTCIGNRFYRTIKSAWERGFFFRLVNMNANEILRYRFMPATAGSGKLIKDLNNSFAFFAQILAPNRGHQFLPKYVELGIFGRTVEPNDACAITNLRVHML